MKLVKLKRKSGKIYLFDSLMQVTFTFRSIFLNTSPVSSVAQPWLTLCDPMDCSTPGFPVHQQLPDFTQNRVHWFDVTVYTYLHMFIHIWCRRWWHPTPVLLPGKSHGWRSLVGCSLWGSRRVGLDWATSRSLFTFIHWRRKWHPTPVFLPGESQGRGSLVGCGLWGRTESGTTEATQQQQHTHLMDIVLIIPNTLSRF